MSRVTPPPAVPAAEPGITQCIAGPNTRSSLTFLGLLLMWATRNAR